ncbi:MAG: hypothetical protein ABUT20_66285, partial [Bacteroidota bacterium]
DTEGYFTGINKSLKKEGLLFISTPISVHSLDNKPENIYHVREWGYNAFQNEVAKYLSIKEIYLQLYPLFNNSFITRLKKKIMRLLDITYPRQESLSTIYRLGELPSQIRIKDLGKKYRGYQILACEKKDNVLL